jgi:hypothetical protein
MNDEKHAVEEGFYQRCAELLGVPYTYRPFPYRRRTRWNNRSAGNGRFEGRGLIRLFGQTVHVALNAPVRVTRSFKSHEETFAFLASLTTGGKLPDI